MVNTHPAVDRVKALLKRAPSSGLPVMHARLRVDWNKEDQNWLDRLVRLRRPTSAHRSPSDPYAGAEERPGEPVI